MNLSGMLTGALGAMTPLLLAAVGGLFTELSGMLNIALEGLITVGAFSAACAASATGSLAAGLAAGAAAGMVLSAAYAFASLRLKANEFIAGLAANLFASGMAVVLSQEIFSTKAVVRLDLPPFPSPVPGSPDIVSILAWLCVPAAWVVVNRTPFGLRLRAVGSRAGTGAVSALGISPARYRFAAILVSGASAGLAGACLSLDLSAYVPGISSGRGWIALVAIYLGGRKPAGILAACFAFAFAESFSNFAQGFLSLPPELILAIPYGATLAALVAGTAFRRAGSSRRWDTRS